MLGIRSRWIRVSSFVPQDTSRRRGPSPRTTKADLGVQSSLVATTSTRRSALPTTPRDGSTSARTLGGVPHEDGLSLPTYVWLRIFGSRRRVSGADPPLYSPQSWSAPSDFLNSCSKFTWWAPSKSWIYPTSISLPFDLWLGLGWSSYKGPSSSWSCSKNGDDGFE